MLFLNCRVHERWSHVSRASWICSSFTLVAFRMTKRTRMNSLSPENRQLYELIKEELNEFKAEMRQLIAGNTSQIQKLNGEVETLKGEVNKLKGLIDDADSYERRDTVIFSGPKIPSSTNGENCIEIVRQLVKTELKVEISASEISTAHRLGRKSTAQTEDKRNIVVKLCRRDLKRDLLVASKKQAKPSSIYINESLTPIRKTILYALRQMRRNHPNIVTGCTSIEGRIYAYTKNENTSQFTRDQRHLINNKEALIEFCTRYVKSPLENFLQNWNF